MQAGDMVQWCDMKIKKNHMTIEQKEGEILEIVNDKAVVKLKNGRKVFLLISRLRLMTEQGHLTQFVNSLK